MISRLAQKIRQRKLEFQQRHSVLSVVRTEAAVSIGICGRRTIFISEDNRERSRSGRFDSGGDSTRVSRADLRTSNPQNHKEVP